MVAATDFHSQDAIDRLVRRELAREGVTMALYVSMTLLAALVAIPTRCPAPWARRRCSGAAPPAWRSPTGSRSTSPPASTAPPTSTGCTGSAARSRWAPLTVALVASIPILVADDVAAEVASVLALILASAGFAVGRHSGAGLGRSLVGGLIVLAIAGLVVAVKIAIDY